MRGFVLMGLGFAGAVAALPALAQGFGITRAPAPPRHAPAERPGYEGAYDRADRSWRDERHDCLYGRKKSRNAARSCDYVQRTPQPLSSDYVKPPSAN